MTQEEKKANFHKLFDGIKIAGLTIHSDAEEDCRDMFGRTYYHHEYYMRLRLNFSGKINEGKDFIDNLTCDKLEGAGLEPYNGKIDKGYMLSLLNYTGSFDIKLQSPYNEEKEYLWENN